MMYTFPIPTLGLFLSIGHIKGISAELPARDTTHGPQCSYPGFPIDILHHWYKVQVLQMNAKIGDRERNFSLEKYFPPRPFGIL